jgi:hypothetical protein
LYREVLENLNCKLESAVSQRAMASAGYLLQQKYLVPSPCRFRRSQHEQHSTPEHGYSGNPKCFATGWQREEPES